MKPANPPNQALKRTAQRFHTHSVKTRTWIAVSAALLFHTALFAAVWLLPRPPEHISPPDFVAADGLITVALDDALLANPIGPSICPVRNVPMTVTEVPIVYGLLWELSDPAAYRRANPTEAPRAIRNAQFPNAEHWSWGGCCVSDFHSTRVYICPECERAEKEWKQTQQNPK